MSDDHRGRIHRRDVAYLSAVVGTVAGAVTYLGPWQGYWEVAGLALLVVGAVLWASWEVIIRV